MSNINIVSGHFIISYIKQEKIKNENDHKSRLIFNFKFVESKSF